MPIILFHELGHFVVARFYKVKVEVFSLGFGKPLIQKKDKQGTIWQLASIPLGGYVKMLDKDIKDSCSITKLRKDFFCNKPLLVRSLIVFSGPIANYLLTILLFTLIFYINGVYKNNTIISEISINSIAEKSGLQIMDKIIDINQVKIGSYQELMTWKNTVSHQLISIGIIRNSFYEEITVSYSHDDRPEDYRSTSRIIKLGLLFGDQRHNYLNIIQSFKTSIKQTGIYSKLMLKTVLGMKTTEIVGPITVAKMSSYFLKTGEWLQICNFIALMSLNLGLMNLFPIPTLDGGYLFFYLIEGIIGKPINSYIQDLCFKFGVIVMLILMILSLRNDFLNFNL